MKKKFNSAPVIDAMIAEFGEGYTITNPLIRLDHGADCRLHDWLEAADEEPDEVAFMVGKSAVLREGGVSLADNVTPFMDAVTEFLEERGMGEGGIAPACWEYDGESDEWLLIPVRWNANGEPVVFRKFGVRQYWTSQHGATETIKPQWGVKAFIQFWESDEIEVEQ